MAGMVINQPFKITTPHILKALEKRHRDQFFITQVKNGPTLSGFGVFDGLRIMDALVINRSYTKNNIVGYEVKVSRNDFLSDEKWPGYLPMCNRFYFACPSGMIKKEEVNTKCGLVYVNEAGKCYTRKKALYRDIELPPEMAWYIIFSKLESDRYPFHSSKADYWKDWLANKQTNQWLGREIGSKLHERLEKAQDELRALKRKHEELDQVLSEFEVRNCYDLRNRLEAPVIERPRWLLNRATYLIEVLSGLKNQIENQLPPDGI